METALTRALQEEAAQGLVKLNFFVLNRTFLQVAVGAVPPQVFQIPNNLDYLINYINGVVFEPAATFIPNPDLLINLADTSTGWLFMDQVMHWGQIVGTAQRPFVLPEPKLVPSNSAIDCNLTNNQAVVIDRIDLALLGSQVIYQAGYSREQMPFYPGGGY